MDAYLFLLVLIHTCAGTAFSIHMTVEILPPYAVVAPSTTVQLDCIVNTTSQASISYKWFTKSSGQISPDNNKFILYENNGTIEINAFSVQDQGQYYCTASNDLGTVKSISTVLEIAFINNVEQMSQSVDFQLNQHLELTCNVPLSVPEPEVSWYKGPSPITNTNRIGKTLNNSIVFSYCTDDDNGPWKCRVKNSLISETDQTPNTYLLKQIAASLISSQSVQIVASPVGQTVIAGGSFELQCIAVGRPPPEYTWLKDGNNIQQNDRITLTQNSQILKVTNANNALDTGAYSCRLYQSTTSTTLFSESASIVVNDPPSILSPVIESPVYHSQYASLSVSLSCSANGTLPITWRWLRNAVFIEESEHILIEDGISNGVTESALEIQNLNPSDGGVWQCIASNDVTGSNQTSQILIVNTTLPLISKQSTSDILVFIGTSITLSLSCEAYPYPIFNWIKGSETLTLQQRHSVGDSNPFSGDLTINPTISNDNGVYRCSCSNTNGTLISKGVIVTITDTPVILVMPNDALVSLDSNVLIHCMIDNYANTQLTVQYTWSRDYTDLPISDRFDIYVNGTLLIKDFETDDIGYYECAVSLDSSSSNVSPLLYQIGGAFITEDPPSHPSPPLNLQLGTITSRGISISWEKPSDIGGLHILGYTIEVTHHGRQDCTFVDQISNITTNATVTQLVISLRPYNQYSVVVYAFNSMGHSNATEGLNMFWTLEEEPSIAPVVISSKQGDNVGELITIWEHPPCQERNGQIINYIIKLNSSVESMVTTPSNLTSLTVGQLRPLQDYMVQVSAVTSTGNGPFSLPILAKTVLASVPDIPRNLRTSEITYMSVHVSWDSPKPRENEPLNDLTMVTHYIVRYYDNEINVTNTNHTAMNLPTGTIVEFSVAGVNSFGIGISLYLETTLPSVANKTAFYREVWFPGFAGGIAGAVIVTVILICLLICVISYCCRKNEKHHNRSFSSNHTSGSVHSFTYPHRKATVFDKMMQVETMESPIPDTNGTEIRLEMTDDSGNGQDSASIGTLTLSQSSSTLRSKYQYRSPMEQEEYQRLSGFRQSTKSDVIRTKVKRDTKNNTKKFNTFKSAPNTSSNTRLTRETSPTDTVSSFEYHSQIQMVRNKRLPSYTTDGYDTSSEDDSVFHSVHISRSQQQKHHHHQSVSRNSSFKVVVDSKRPPNLALMTALPQINAVSYMPTAIPMTPTDPTPLPTAVTQSTDSVAPLSTTVPLSYQPTNPVAPLSTKSNHIQQFSRLPRLRPNEQQDHINDIDLREKRSTFV